MSNRRNRDSDDPRLETSLALEFLPEESLPLSPSPRKIWIVHLSLVMERSPQFSGVEVEPCTDEIFLEKNGSSDDARGNSAILSMRGALTEMSGETIPFRTPRLRLAGVSNVGKGSDALLLGRADLSAGVLNGCRCARGNRES